LELEGSGGGASGRGDGGVAGTGALEPDAYDVS
jgi:hypothetical protein